MNHTVLRHDEDGVATLTLNRPAALNALNGEVFLALRAHARALKTDTAIGCVVLRGAGRAFSAGLDLNEVVDGKLISEVTHPFRADTVAALAALPQPLIAALHGICFTGALELALAADLIITTEHTRFKDTHARLGFTPLWGLSQRLPRRIGMAAATELMFTGREFNGAQALALGLANRCVAADEFDSAVRGFAREITAHSWPSLVIQKRLLHEGAAMALDEALAYERATSPGAV